MHKTGNKDVRQKTSWQYSVDAGTYPCPARKPRLEGLTLSLNITISMLWHLGLAEVKAGEHSSTIHHWSDSPFDSPGICWSLMDMGLKKASSSRSMCSKGRHGPMNPQRFRLNKHTHTLSTLNRQQMDHRQQIIIIKKHQLTYFHPGCHFGFWALWTPKELRQQRLNHPGRQKIITSTSTFKKKTQIKLMKTTKIADFANVTALHCKQFFPVRKKTTPEAASETAQWFLLCSVQWHSHRFAAVAF